MRAASGSIPPIPTSRRVLALARELIGFPRHLSQHVGGFVITRGRLDEVVPIENAAMEERTCVEWDKDDLDALGILKIDVLGLGMLTCLRRGFDLLNKHYAKLPPPHGGLPPPLASPSPRVRGEGRGEGALPHAGAIEAQTRGEAPSPGAQGRADLSPHAGRGEVAPSLPSPAGGGGKERGAVLSRRHPGGGSRHLRHAVARGFDRRVPGREPGADVDAAAPQAARIL